MFPCKHRMCVCVCVPLSAPVRVYCKWEPLLRLCAQSSTFICRRTSKKTHMRACLTSPHVPPSRASQGRRTPGRLAPPDFACSCGRVAHRPTCNVQKKEKKKKDQCYLLSLFVCLIRFLFLFFSLSSFLALDKSRPIGFQTTTSRRGSEGCAPAGVTTQDE